MGESYGLVGESGLYASADAVEILSFLAAGSALSQRLFFLASSDVASATSAIFGSGGVFRDERLASSVSAEGRGICVLGDSGLGTSGSGGGCHVIRSSTFFFSFSFFSSSSSLLPLERDLDLELSL